MNTREINVYGKLVKCFDDGSVEFEYCPSHKKLHRTFGSTDGCGYKRVRINGHQLSVHRIICEAFNGTVDGKDFVDHINRNKADNRPENLRWVTREENQENTDRTDNGIKKFGIRSCEDKQEYNRRYRNSTNQLNATLPSGKHTTYRNIPEDLYSKMVNMTQKERYAFYSPLVRKHK